MEKIVTPVLDYLRLTSCADKMVHFVFVWSFVMMFLMAFIGYQIINEPNYIRTLLNIGPSLINPTAWASQDAARTLAMNDIRTEIDADRVLLMIIHDGIRAVNDYPALYASAISEVVRPGLISVIDSFQKLPLSSFEGIIPVVAGECMTYYPFESSSSVAVNTRTTTSSQTVVRCPVFDPQGRPLGFMTASFIGKITDLETLRQIQMSLQRYSAFMAGHMVNR